MLECCRFSPDGRLLVAAGEGGVLKLYGAAAQDKRVRVEKQNDSPWYPGAASSLAFLPDGKRLFAAGYNRTQVWEVDGWRRTTGVRGNCVAVSHDGKTVALGDYRRGIVEVGEAIKLLR